MDRNNIWAYIKVGFVSRSMAFHIIAIFLVATAVGSVLPEFGNALAIQLDKWSHTFNPVFLIVGIIGIGVALYLGYRQSI